MSTLLKKISLTLLSVVVLFISFAPYLSVKAQADWYNPGPFEFYTKVFDETNNDIFGERYTYAQVVWIEYSLLGSIIGVSKATMRELLAHPELIGQTIQSTGTQPGGLIGKSSEFVGKAIASPPASFRYWLSTIAQKYSIVGTVKAQGTGEGFGYGAITMLLPLWSASRNIAFALMIVIIIMIAFAVMFRVKINPQLAVTIQSSLPKIASALVLIIFSYALVGLMIDFMYLIFGAFVWGISAAGGLSTALGLTPDKLWDDFLNTSILSKAGGTIWTTIVVGIVAILASALASGGAAAPIVVPFVIGLVIAIIIFFVKAFLMLAQTYISLVINIVFAPLIILSEAIPFVKMSALGWFKSVVADLMIFLAVGFLFFLQDVLWALFGKAGVNAWSPPYLHFNSTIFQLLIWVGIWAMLPNIRPMVYQMFEKRASDVPTPREFQGLTRGSEQAWERAEVRQNIGNMVKGWFARR